MDQLEEQDLYLMLTSSVDQSPLENMPFSCSSEVKNLGLYLFRGKDSVLETFAFTPLTESGGEGSVSCGLYSLPIPSSQSFQIR